MQDEVNHTSKLHEIYMLDDPTCTSRVTVPVLWDKAKSTIACNESADIIRMFNTAFDHLGARAGDYYPVGFRSEIDAVNARIYEALQWRL